MNSAVKDNHSVGEDVGVEDSAKTKRPWRNCRGILEIWFIKCMR